MPMTAILAQYICDWKRLLYELLYGITNETIYVPSKDSDQTEHPFSLIRVIHVHSMTNISFLYYSGQTPLIREIAGCKAQMIAFLMQWRIAFLCSRSLSAIID